MHMNENIYEHLCVDIYSYMHSHLLAENNKWIALSSKSFSLFKYELIDCPIKVDLSVINYLLII